MVPSPPKTRMASASAVVVGSSCCQVVWELDWNGLRSAGEVPGPKMAAARIVSHRDVPKFCRGGRIRPSKPSATRPPPRAPPLTHLTPRLKLAPCALFLQE